jgi:hypothetical protein
MNRKYERFTQGSHVLAFCLHVPFNATDIFLTPLTPDFKIYTRFLLEGFYLLRYNAM